MAPSNRARRTRTVRLDPDRGKTDTQTVPAYRTREFRVPDSDSTAVDYELADGVATITLNRPDSLNSLTTETKESLLDAVEQAKRDSSRAVLLTGNGKAFCAG